MSCHESCVPVMVREFALGQLGVAHVLEGSVQRVGNEVRITVQLIDARTDQHLWSETYQRQLGGLLEIQIDIAREVADRLASSLTRRTRDRILAGMTNDPGVEEDPTSVPRFAEVAHVRLVTGDTTLPGRCGGMSRREESGAWGSSAARCLRGSGAIRRSGRSWTGCWSGLPVLGIRSRRS